MLKKVLVIFVVLIISTVLFVILNPLEKLRESRDEVRIAELNNLKQAVDFYIKNNAKDIALKPTLVCTICSIGEEVFSFRQIKVSNTGVTTVEKQSAYVNGNGWLPLDLSLNAKPGEIPLRLLPIDPLEKGYNFRTKLPFLSKDEDFVYTYSAGLSDKYKLTAKMESQKALVKARNDGGTLSNRLEIGTDLSLNP